MGFIFVQHTADHTLIDQFGTGIGLPFRYSRTYTVGKDKTISNIIYLRFLKGFGSQRRWSLNMATYTLVLINNHEDGKIFFDTYNIPYRS